MKLTDLKHRDYLGTLLNSMGLTGLGVEIGVAYGEYSERILQKWGGSGLFLVDPWKKWSPEEYVDGSSKIDFDGAFYETLKRMANYPGRSIILRMTSDEAARVVPDGSVDFVYVDGNHHDPQVTRDLENWWPKIKVGGLFGGHDYHDIDEPHYRCEVKSAVTRFCKKNKLEVNHSTVGFCDESWWILKK